MSKRSLFFQEGEIYHVFNKSIANYCIFNKKELAERFIEILEYYNNPENKISYSLAKKYTQKFTSVGLLYYNPCFFFKIIAYCIMPDHYHLVIKILGGKSLSKYISDVENSFTRYFNLKFKRKGPLWESRFKFVLIENNKQLLHVVRYVHLNPTTSNFVDKPENWPFSSYKEYLKNKTYLQTINEISIKDIDEFKKFTQNNVEYQKTLKKIKKKLLE